MHVQAEREEKREKEMKGRRGGEGKRKKTMIISKYRVRLFVESLLMIRVK